MTNEEKAFLAEIKNLDERIAILRHPYTDEIEASESSLRGITAATAVLILLYLQLKEATATLVDVYNAINNLGTIAPPSATGGNSEKSSIDRVE